ncbi:MAG: response regulator [Treponema sp.]|jgi:CheY-like chemotaxis protein/HPt (histidine-containing phosphotransfer) domain-containing protein|nr:response regulator [Treponema sp.]
MICKERLLAISELKLAEIQQMDGNKLNIYVKSLNSFTDGLPELEEEIKSALEKKDYASLSKCLEDTRGLLAAIHADDMADECAKQIKELKEVRHEKLEAFMAYFLTSLSMLSLDIQMAELKEQKDQANESSEQKPSAKTDQPKTILAVDDTPFFLTTLKNILQDTEYKLICVTSGGDALKFLEKHHPDLLLLDIEMPEMNGYELVANIRKSGEKARIIFLTGNAKRENVVRAVEAGAADFIVKPVNKEGVLAKINRYI